MSDEKTKKTEILEAIPDSRETKLKAMETDLKQQLIDIENKNTELKNKTDLVIKREAAAEKLISIATDSELYLKITIALEEIQTLYLANGSDPNTFKQCIELLISARNMFSTTTAPPDDA